MVTQGLKSAALNVLMKSTEAISEVEFITFIADNTHQVLSPLAVMKSHAQGRRHGSRWASSISSSDCSSQNIPHYLKLCVSPLYPSPVIQSQNSTCTITFSMLNNKDCTEEQ